MLYQIIKPPKHLARWVKSFWIVEGDTSGPNGIANGSMAYRLMADPCPEIVFQYRNQFWDSNSEKKDPISSVTGQNHQIRELTVAGKYGLIGVCLYPFTIEKLFGFPAKEITNQVFDIYSLMGNEGKWLEEKIMNQETNQARFAIISQFLMARLQKANNEKDLAVSHIAKKIFESRGRLSISDVSSDANLSFRQFERQFKRSTGLTPKLFSRIVRFQSAIKQANFFHPRTLTELAYETGYADQSHFIREFKTFSGLNPKAYFKISEEVADTFVQVPRTS